MQLHDTALTIAGGALLSVCLVAGGIATVASDLGGEVSAEVLEITGVKGEPKDAGASAKDSKVIPAETTLPATEEPTETPVEETPQQPTEVPPAAPVAPQAVVQETAVQQTERECEERWGTSDHTGHDHTYQQPSAPTAEQQAYAESRDQDGSCDGSRDGSRHSDGGGHRSGGGHR